MIFSFFFQIQGDSAVGILEHKQRHDENFVMIFGSSFKDDCSDDYAYMMLSSIILHMEAGRYICTLSYFKVFLGICHFEFMFHAHGLISI
jgi:hypothetical protein